MPRKQPHVKAPRAYDSSKRRQEAEQTRERILQVAEQLFRTHGYARTSIAAVAAAAGVSVETIYKAVGGKPGLVRAIREKALEGNAPVPAEMRSDALQINERDPRAIITGWAALAQEVAPRVVPILLVVRAAAAVDPRLEALQQELDEARLTRMTHNARSLLEAGHIRPGVTLDEAADVLWAYSSPELYELLVITRGWPVDRYGRFIADAMIAALLPDGGDGQRDADDEARSGAAQP
jgi:AcrR family transcriptional regulator